MPNELISPKDFAKDIDKIVEETCEKFGNHEREEFFKCYFKTWLLGENWGRNSVDSH